MTEFMGDVLRCIWEQAAVQIDAHTHCRTIKLASCTFYMLGEQGELYFKQQASLILNKPAEFYIDGTDNNRFYLGVGAELEYYFNFTIQPIQGFRIAALFPPPPHPIISAHGYSSVARPQFGCQMPAAAPQYPAMDPYQRSMVPQVTAANGLSQGWNNAINAEVPVGLVKDEDVEDDNEDDDENEEEDQEEKIKRPPNAWILYRQAHDAPERLANPGAHNSVISKNIAERWNALSPAEQKPWYDKAAVKAAEHRLMYPDYYANKSRKRKRRARAPRSQRARPTSRRNARQTMPVQANVHQWNA
ncbi:hypothetical protein F4678DRAFT_478962 [Xylaria arbuscula]|nr:hypothetical protein F4678DRAFT_478962 [Xylaria arbuscula]